MSSKNVVNPDHYKVAGRDRQGEAIAARPRPSMNDEQPGPPSGQVKRNFIPGAQPVGEAPERADDGREAQSSGEKAGTHSTAEKQASASRGGKAPAKTRPVAGAFDKGDRTPPRSTARRGPARRDGAKRGARKRAA